jgi:hypothetical protein
MAHHRFVKNHQQKNYRIGNDIVTIIGCQRLEIQIERSGGHFCIAEDSITITV